MKHLIVAVILALSLAACGSEPAAESKPGNVTTSPSPSPAERKAKTATDVAEVIKAEVSEIEKIVTITEDNDPNELIGRPNGYIDGAVMFDPRAEPYDDELGVDQGATLELWPDADSASTRSEYILGIQKESGGMLGSEYHYKSEGFLLRVSGELKPSEAAAYESAFESAF